MLLIHGAHDTTAPPHQTVLMWETLRRRGAACELLWLNDLDHATFLPLFFPHRHLSDSSVTALWGRIRRIANGEVGGSRTAHRGGFGTPLVAKL